MFAYISVVSWQDNKNKGVDIEVIVIVLEKNKKESSNAIEGNT